MGQELVSQWQNSSALTINLYQRLIQTITKGDLLQLLHMWSQLETHFSVRCMSFQLHLVTTFTLFPCSCSFRLESQVHEAISSVLCPSNSVSTSGQDPQFTVLNLFLAPSMSNIMIPSYPYLHFPTTLSQHHITSPTWYHLAPLQHHCDVITPLAPLWPHFHSLCSHLTSLWYHIALLWHCYPYVLCSYINPRYSPVKT